MMNGTVQSSHQTATPNTTVTLTPQPATNYALGSIDVTGSPSGTTPSGGLTNNGNGTYSFTMPNEDVYVGATFLPATTVTIDDTNLTNLDILNGTNAGSLTATVTENVNNTAVSGATVTWASSDTNVATVNNGTITLVGIGTTNITATYAGNQSYAGSVGTYSLTVVDNTPSTGTDVTFTAGTETGSSSMTKSNVTISCTNANFTYNPYRIYAGTVTTISVPAGYTITKVVINGANGYDMSKFTANGGAYSVNSNNVGTWTGDASSVEFTNTHTAQLRVTSFVVTIESTGSTPTISASPSTLNTFSYLSSSTDPSAAQQVSVSGANLSADITVSVGANSAFEMCTTENGTYSDNDITLQHASGGVVAATPIYVRMKANQTGNPTGTLTLSSTGATSVTIALNGSVVTPMTVAQAITAINNASGNDIPNSYVTGIVSSIVTAYDSDYDNVTFDIVDAVGDQAFLRAYRCGGSYASTVAVGDVVVVSGTIYHYTGNNSSIYEFHQGCQIVSLTPHQAQQYTLAVTSVSNAEIIVFDATDPDDTNWLYLFEDVDDAQVTEGTPIALSVSADQGYGISSLMVDGVEHVADIAGGLYTFNMPTHNVNITLTAMPVYNIMFSVDGQVWAEAQMEVNQGQAIGTLPTPVAASIPAGYVFVGWYTDNYTNATTAPNFVTASFVPTSDITLKAVFAEVSGSPNTYALVSNVADLHDGDIIIMVSTGSYNSSGTTHNFTVANGEVNNNDLMDPVDVTISEDKVTSTDVAPITLVAVQGGWKLMMGNQYLKNVSGQNKIILDSEGAINTISISSDIASIGGIADGNDTRNIFYNPNSGNGRFAYYKTAQKPVSIYKQESVVYSNYCTSSTEIYSEFTLTIDGYGADYDPENNNNAGYYLIASPVSEAITPNQNNGFITGNYDLYYFDYAAGDGLEWRNFKDASFAIQPCKGYLYASYGDTELVFSGTEYGNTQAEDGEIELNAGWNLIGNPYNDITDLFYSATDDYVLEYYKMNEDGNELELVDDVYSANSEGIAPMEGVFVWSENGNESVYFLGQNIFGSPSNVGSLSINISKNCGNVIDRAIVRFNGRSMMPKLQLNPNHTKVYFTQGNQDYAIVHSSGNDEMAVNFKAESNGSYTIAVSPQNVELEYLHLIDNMTGADIDLLATPSYTFEAKTTDYASRFRLVFSAEENGASTGSATFAFFNGSEWVVSNTGEATLQVVDVLGRVLSTETVNGNATINVNQPTGVYMLRLINGDNVRVQKVVVR